MRVLKGCVVIVFLMSIAMAVYMQHEMNKMGEDSLRQAEEHMEEVNARMEEIAQMEDAIQPRRIPKHPSADTPPPEGPTSMPPAPPGWTIIPPVHKGTMKEMWSKLKTPDRDLFLPTFGLEKMHETIKEKGAENVKAWDFSPKYLYVRQINNGREMVFLAVYSDDNFFNGKDVMLRTISPRDVLEMALFDKNADGIYFNPKSRILDDHRYAYGTNRYGIAEIIGYLEAPDDPGDTPYQELANKAAFAKQWYLAQYYWAMARREARPGDDWKEAELAKLKAWWALDFPESRKRAVDELDWFIKNHKAPAEAKPLLQMWTADLKGTR